MSKFEKISCPDCGSERAYITEGRVYRIYIHCPDCGYTERVG